MVAVPSAAATAVARATVRSRPGAVRVVVVVRMLISLSKYCVPPGVSLAVDASAGARPRGHASVGKATGSVNVAQVGGDPEIDLGPVAHAEERRSRVEERVAGFRPADFKSIHKSGSQANKDEGIFKAVYKRLITIGQLLNGVIFNGFRTCVV